MKPFILAAAMIGALAFSGTTAMAHGPYYGGHRHGHHGHHHRHYRHYDDCGPRASFYYDSFGYRRYPVYYYERYPAAQFYYGSPRVSIGVGF